MRVESEEEEEGDGGILVGVPLVEQRQLMAGLEVQVHVALQSY